MKQTLIRIKPVVYRVLVTVAGVIGLIAATAGPAAAGLNNHTEPFTAAR